MFIFVQIPQVPSKKSLSSQIWREKITSMSNMFIFLQLWSNFCLQANSTFLSFSFRTVILQGCWQGRNSRRIHPRSSVPFDLGLWIVSPFSSGGTLWCWPGTGLERDPASPTGFSRREGCQGSSGSLRQVGQNRQPHYSFVLLFLYPSMEWFQGRKGKHSRGSN